MRSATPSILRSVLVALALVPGRAQLDAAEAESPVHHLVLFDFGDDVPSPEVREIERRMAELPREVPGILRLQWGTNNSPEGLDRGYTHAFLLTFEDQEALDAYTPHPAHRDLVDYLQPRLEKVFVNDFAVEELEPVAEPGRTHHLVFFKYQDSASGEEIADIEERFAALEGEIPGLLAFRTGEDRTPEGRRQGYRPYWVTFTNERARDAYLPHPAHRAFVDVVRPLLDEVLVVDFTVRPSSRSLFIVDGLEPYRVYQRGPDGTATLEFSGVCAEEGPVEARLRGGRRTVPGFDWRQVGEVEAGVFEARLEDVPAGGPYTVEVRRRDALGNVASYTEVADILVGDLWILAGQSNMQGVGDLEDVVDPHPSVHCFTMGHRWELAREPLHWLIDSPDPVHSGRRLDGCADEAERRARRARARRDRTKGAGLGLPFARELVEATDVPVGLIASAHGGTSMSQWDPSLAGRGGESLYGSMLRQVENAGGQVRGVLWYQGESDANPDAVPKYAERLRGLVEAFRRDLDDPELPFYYVQIGRFVREGSSQAWDTIQELQRQAEGEIAGARMASVIDLSLDDPIHLSTQGLERAGGRLARLVLMDHFGFDHLRPGPRPARIVAVDGGRRVRVVFSGVNGGLLPEDNLSGFSLEDAEGNALERIFDAFVDPEAPDEVVLELARPLPDGAKLWYGRGLNPVCELVDEEDLAAPVFGPLPVER